jgi:type I restriction enzyme S subunit
VSWYGELPERWEAHKITEIFSERQTKVSDTEFAPLSVSKDGVVPQMASVAKSNAGDDRKLVKTGDFVINSRSDRRGSSGISQYDGSVSLINIVLEPRKEENGRYYHYLLRSHNFIEEYYRNGRGIVADLWTTRLTEMKTIYLPLPPRDEQDQIVRYLDWKVSRINKLINAKRRQIELLQEQKRAIIDEAITKGEEDWTHRRLKTLVRNINEKDTPTGKFYIGMENIVSWTAEFVDTSIVVDGDSKSFTQGDVLFGKLRPYLAKVYMPERTGVYSGEFLVLRGFEGYLPFLKYFLLSYSFVMDINASTYGAKMPRANWSFIGDCLVSLPDITEQHRIVALIEDKCNLVNKAISNLNTEISFLAEYRTRLISDVVTGKLDVRGVVVPEYEVVDEVEKDENSDATKEMEESL